MPNYATKNVKLCHKKCQILQIMPQKMPNFSTYAIFAENNCNGLSNKLEVLLLTSQNSEFKVQFSVSCLEHQAPAPIVSLGWLHAQMTLGEPT